MVIGLGTVYRWEIQGGAGGGERRQKACELSRARKSSASKGQRLHKGSIETTLWRCRPGLSGRWRFWGVRPAIPSSLAFLGIRL